jgi:DNA-binding winged helix-turn-helix (wHTH) protein
MLWQLIGTIFLVVLLVVCMLYQIKTILFQKRIDGIRREFMKNMIYEMKQSLTDDAAKDDVNIIGDTKFYYSMNELNFGDKTVIVTSRQAEIIKILSDNINEVVPRNEILEKVWGDDSYSNSMALNVQITYIRRAFSSDSSISIEAIMKKGYLLKVLKNSDK